MLYRALGISIHVPRAGYDSKARLVKTERKVFLSTYPVRGTTADLEQLAGELPVFLSTYPVRGTT